jgi:hypothetical protein
MFLVSHVPISYFGGAGFVASPDTGSATEDFHCFIQFSKEKYRNNHFLSCVFQLDI